MSVGWGGGKRHRHRCGRSGVRFPNRSQAASVVNGSSPKGRFFGVRYCLCCPGASGGDGPPLLVTRLDVIPRVE